MQVLILVILFCIAFGAFLFSARVFNTSYNTLGKWTKWIFVLMLIAVALALLLNRTADIILDLMNQFVDVLIPVISGIPIIREIVPFIKAIPTLIITLLWALIVAIPVVGIVIGYYRGRYGSESYPPYEQPD